MKFLLLSALLALTACNPRKKVITNFENTYDDSATQTRLGDLEQRVAALEAQVALNISQIGVNGVSISSLQSQLSSEVLSLQEEISGLNSEISELEHQLDQTNSSSNANSTAIANAEQDLDTLRQQLLDTQALLNQAIAQGGQAYSSILSSISTLSNSSSALQTSVNTLVGQMAQLQLQDTVVGIVDPCPTVPSSDYKENFFKMKSGKLVAYFESGSNRFLSVLTPGNYRTTDSRSCNFTVNADSTITVPSSIPTGASHKLLICGQIAYKVGATISLNGTAYINNFSTNGCNVVINNSANNVSSNGGLVSNASVCNYNNISTVTGTQNGSGANSSGCYVTKL